MLKVLRTKTRKIMMATLILVIPSFVMFYGWSSITNRGNRARNPETYVFAEFLPPDSHRLGVDAWEKWHEVSRGEMYSAQEYLKDALGRLGGSKWVDALFSQFRFEEVFTVGDQVQNALNVYALRAYADRHSIRVPDQEIVASIQNMFPGWSLAQVRSAIHRRGMSEQAFEHLLRSGIRNNYVMRDFMAQAKVSVPELWREYRLREDNLQVGFVSFLLSAYSSRVEVSEAGLKDYYDRNQESFRMGEQRRYGYACLTRESIRRTVKPTEEDIARFYEENKDALYKSGPQARVRQIFVSLGVDRGASQEELVAASDKALQAIQQIKALVENGSSDFAALANEFSQDPENVSLDGKTKHGGEVVQPITAESVSDYGARFVETVLGLQVGEIAGPLPVDGARGRGYSIVRCEEAQTPSPEPLEKVLDRVTSDCLESMLGEAFEDKYEAMRGEVAGFNDIQFLASQLGMSDGETSWVLKSSFQIAPELGTIQDADLDYIQNSLKAGEISDLFLTPEAICAVQVLEEKPSYVQDFEDVRPQVEAIYREEKGREAMKAAAETFMTQATTPAEMKAQATELGLKYKETSHVTRLDLEEKLTTDTFGTLLDLDRNSAFVRPGDTRMNAVSDFATSVTAYVVWHAIDVQEPSREEFLKDLPSFRAGPLAIKQNAMVDEWLLDKRREMKVEMNPEL
ncbi:peptidyl-prolyl cis-trans isomerase [Candidatus Sumerlaeota bacterium]|nr:peptidyl-prolyl cis-trans isomerase [Candidatus Sumerlaeota bacterium]